MADQPPPPDTGDAFEYALSSNNAWAGYKGHQNPDFFPKLASGQAPQIRLQPGDVFVHRNIANIVSPTDINTSAVIEYAVAHLKVKHVVLAGHTSCGGAAAALGDSRVGGVLDTWLTPLKAIKAAHGEELSSISDAKERATRIAELNVDAGVKILLANHVIQEAIQDRGLKVKGVIFDIGSGRLRDLGVGNTGDAGAPEGTVRGKHAMLVFRGTNAAMKVT
ncbi:Carbonic anhydrase [Zalerion maritima]|uniref:Carbonic anhydrase n=1 Tax=Zalerion maritima TaxID=339359 RepID=A0AAD5RZ27_9PEZI|nr:Carbonic anhydrase [Zalerion maritima]